MTYKSGAEEETICFFDVSLGLEAFANQVNKTVKPPKKNQRSIVYDGVEAGHSLLFPAAVGTELDEALLSKLDNAATHLVQITEKY